MSLSDIFKNDLRSIIRDQGCKVLTWKGEDYHCSVSSTNNSKNLESGGYMLETNNTFVVVKSDFCNFIYPKEQEKIIYSGVTYRIFQVNHESNNSFIRLLCQQEVK